MTDENCWFGHWFRGDVGFPYPISGRQVEAARKYSKALWLGNKWPGQTRSLQWLVEKFSPPGWEGYEFAPWEGAVPDEELRLGLSKAMYNHIHKRGREPHWRGTKVVKQPTDLLLYHEVIWQNKPKWIVETGTRFGGSAKFFQDQLRLVGEGGRVITVDLRPVPKDTDPDVTYLTGSSRDQAIIDRIREMVGDDTVMVVLDSDHSRVHVKWELEYYAPLVTPGQYLVVEDCYAFGTELGGPGEARDWFLAKHRMRKDFEQTNLERRFIVGVCSGGWLRRKP
jgi:cephalosporin hydroxylase